MCENSTRLPHPIFKWAGGKTSLLSVFDETNFIPDDFNTYYEPFFGAGALFFHLWGKGKIKGAVLSDINSELFNVYSIVKADCESLISYAKVSDLSSRKKSYYDNRDRFNELKRIPLKKCSEDEKLERAILMLYLNKTCYSGMYRENKNGAFNVPFGNYKNPRIIDEDNLRRVSESFSNVIFRNEDYKKILKTPSDNDFVYLDPPYMPCSGVSHFRDYHRSGFNQDEQKRLCNSYKALNKIGCKVMLSNSSSPELNRMYVEIPGVKITTVSALRLINQKNIGRTYVNEYVITNYI
jgi:DNA adenine methylase (dam)